MLKTRIVIDHGGDLNVRESVDEVAEMIEKAMARAQMRRLKSEGWERPLKIIRYTADSEILNWRI